MNIRQQVDGLNTFLTAVFGTEARLSSVLKELGFNEQQIELIRTSHLERVVTQYLVSIRGRMLEWQDDERLFAVLSRRYGWDGQAPLAAATTGTPTAHSIEQIARLERDAVEKWKPRSLQQFLKWSLHSISLRLIDEITAHPDQSAITAKLRRLADLRVAFDSSKTDYESRKKAILMKIQPDLDSLEAEYAPLFKALTKQETTATAEIKNDVLRFGASVRTDTVKAVYTKGRVTWDTKGLTRYAEAHSDVLEFRKQGTPVVILRFSRQGKRGEESEASEQSA
jgi:phage host-nuclease inhibitor protein Gam